MPLQKLRGLAEDDLRIGDKKGQLKLIGAKVTGRDAEIRKSGRGAQFNPKLNVQKKQQMGVKPTTTQATFFYEKYSVETNLAVKIFALRFRHNFRERFIHRFPMQIESSRGAVTDLQRRQIGMDAKDGDRRREMTRIENMDLYHCATYIG